MLEKILNHKLWSVAGQFLATGFINLGLVLLGWGTNDMAGFFSNPARTAYAAAVMVRAVVSSWMVHVMPPHAKQEHHDDLGRWHAYASELIFVLAGFNDRRGTLVWDENPGLRWAGLGIYLLGWALALWAGFTWLNHLRREGDRAVENPVLMFEGPFKWIRYPGMDHIAIYCLGAAVVFRSWAGLVLMVPLVWGIINRVNGLEKFYADRYPRVWPLRRHSSRRLIPFVY